MKEIFKKYSRASWSAFAQSKKESPVTERDLVELTSLGDRVNLQDVDQIYLPLVDYLHLFYTKKKELEEKRAHFLQTEQVKIPFIIGISGSVAVGKSTSARLITLMLKRLYPELQAQLITTDGFLYSTAELNRRNLLGRKGFPDSYNMNLLYDFLNDVSSGKPDVTYPIYSHNIYDIVPGEFGHVTQPDILIVEGINVLQLPANQELYISDFFDFSLYLDADEDQIEEWYLSRFKRILELAQNDPENYYYKYAHRSMDDAIQMAKDVWQEVNLTNLREYIAPTKPRANLILHKTKHHLIDSVWLRKY